MNFLTSMLPNINAFLVCCFFGATSLLNADDFKPGKAFPTNTTSRADLPLSSFINQKSLTTDWSLVVLLRGEQYHILNDKVNRELLSQPVVQGDVVVLDEAAASFLNWKRQNPESELDLFWKSNPQLLTKSLRHTSAALGSGSSAPNSDDNPPSGNQQTMPLLKPPPVAQPPTQKAPEAKPTTTTPSEEPASSTPWSIIVVLIVAATGLWLLVKKRK